MHAASTTKEDVRRYAEDGYEEFRELLADRVARNTQPLFRVDRQNLFKAFLENLPEEHRKHYTCRCCENFINRFGTLVKISDNGVLVPLLWLDLGVPEFFKPAVQALARIVCSAEIDCVYLHDGSVMGTPETGLWTHFYGKPAKASPKAADLTYDQTMAEKREDFKMLAEAVGKFPLDIVRKACTILRADALDRSEKTLGVAEFFLALHETLKERRSSMPRGRFLWQAVAKAPTGFCHISSSMIGTLLTDLKADMPLPEVQRRWAAKMHPMLYQRPQAPPAEGTIDQAEVLFDKLGATSALRRRYARLDECRWLWRVPRRSAEVQAGDGAFGHLRQKDKRMDIVALPPKTMTIQKFLKEVMSRALQVEVMLRTHENFYGLVTAVDPDSRPLLQWDGLEGHPRNPVSWYIYQKPKEHPSWQEFSPYTPEYWGLKRNAWAHVTALMLTPPMWQEPEKFKHLPSGLMVVINACRDPNPKGCLGLFPECLRSEYRSVRSVIEAHAATASAEGVDQQDANGLFCQADSTRKVMLRVTTADSVSEYTLDRWD